MSVVSFQIDPQATALTDDQIVDKVNAASNNITRAGSVEAAARPIEALEVGTSQLALLAVTDAQLAADAVTNPKIAPLAVDSAEMAEGAVVTAKIADDAVTGDRARAVGVLTASAQPANNDTVTIDGKVYTFETSLTDVDGNVLIGAAATDSLDNLIAAINLAAGAGTLYATSMTEHATVDAAAGAGDTIDATAKTGGTGGNALATTVSSATLSWGAGTLGSGTDSKLASLAARDNLDAESDGDRKYLQTNPVTGENKIVSLQRDAAGLLDVDYLTPVE